MRWRSFEENFRLKVILFLREWTMPHFFGGENLSTLFSPFLLTDVLRLRFLRARKFDVAKAKEMLVSCEQWRKDYNVDDIVKYVSFSASSDIYPSLTSAPQKLRLQGKGASRQVLPTILPQDRQGDAIARSRGAR
jgi:hypothetical protein